MAKPIGTLGTIDTLTVAGCVFTDLANIIVLAGILTTTANIGTLRKSNGTAAAASGYQVTTGKTYLVRATKIFNTAAEAAGSGIEIAYGDNDCGMDGTTPITNPHYWGWNVHSGVSPLTSVATSGANISKEFPVFFPVPALKYCSITSASFSNCGVSTFGYES